MKKLLLILLFPTLLLAQISSIDANNPGVWDQVDDVLFNNWGYFENAINGTSSFDVNSLTTASNPCVDVTYPDFGAVGDGVTDDAPAIRAAIANLGAVQHTQTLATTSSRRLYFPKGIYRIGSAITADTDNAVQYVEITGDKAILVIDAGVVAFGGIATECHFTGLQFHGGAVAISIKTNNTDTSKITIDNCIFLEQTTACIRADSGSNSTLLNIDNCKFMQYSNPTSAVLDCGSLDATTFFRCWVSGSPTRPFIASGARLTIRDCQLYPDDTDPWIEQTGASVILNNTLFSGEDGGGTIVDFNNAGGQLRVENCNLFSNNAAVDFNELPSVFVWRNNTGTIGTVEGFQFNASNISQADVNDFWTAIPEWDIKGEVIFNSGSQALSGLFNMVDDKIFDRIPVIDINDVNVVVPAHTASYGQSVTSTIAVSTNQSDPIMGYTCSKAVASADDQSINIKWTTALNGLDAGPYTCVRYYYVESVTGVWIKTWACRRNQYIHLAQGPHILSMPFDYDGDHDEIGFNWSNAIDTDTVWYGPSKILEGYREVDSINTIAYGEAAPTASIQFYIMDKVVNTSPGSGVPTGWVCSVAGTPGTWVAEPNYP